MQLLIGDGLHEVVQRGDFISLRDKIGISGDKDDLDRIVSTSYLLCEVDAVHRPHLDIQQENVKVLRLLTLKEKSLRGRK